jgi:hypothetical protein
MSRRTAPGAGKMILFQVTARAESLDAVDDSLNNYPGIYYDPKNPANIKDLQNRQLFLRIASQKVPDFAGSLFESTVPVIAEGVKVNGSFPRRDSPGSDEYYIQAFSAIREWARRFNIEAAWIVSEAYGIVILGLRYAESGIDPVLAFGGWRRKMHPRKTHQAFLLPAWDPEAETPAAYVVRADQEWQRLRDQHIEAKKAELERSGFRKVPAPRTKKFSLELRLTWAVLHRCGGKSVDDLADEYREETEAIRISVARILKDLGLQSPT